MVEVTIYRNPKTPLNLHKATTPAMLEARFPLIARAIEAEGLVFGPPYRRQFVEELKVWGCGAPLAYWMENYLASRHRLSPEYDMKIAHNEYYEISGITILKLAQDADAEIYNWEADPKPNIYPLFKAYPGYEADWPREKLYDFLLEIQKFFHSLHRKREWRTHHYHIRCEFWDEDVPYLDEEN